MKIIFDYFEDTEVKDDGSIVDEIERVADLIRQGFTSGELTAGEGAGWWHIDTNE